MSAFSQVLKALRKLPGIGPKSAERIAFHLLSRPREEVRSFTQSVEDFIQKTTRCSVCALLSEYNPCRLCTSPKRNRTILCVVKSAQDALSIERSKGYLGLYHVLEGLLSPLNHVYEKQLNVSSLLKRLVPHPLPAVKELIFALEKSLEAEATIKLVLARLPANAALKITRMAIGIPTGVGLEYVDSRTIQEAFSHRYSLQV